MTGDERCDLAIVGGGVAGRSAGIFAARHGLDTAILDAGSSLLRRNAHLENYPGFPAGVDPRLLLDMMLDQATRAGCTYREADVTRVDETGDVFRIETGTGDRWSSKYVIAATKNAVDYLEHLDGLTVVDRGKTFVETDDRGHTGVDGLYAAGRLAGKPHQAIVAAGHGAEVALAIVEADERPFYHDWVAPDRYFTGRGRAVPPGCEEIDERERVRRVAESIAVVREYFAEPRSDVPEHHPSVESDE